jgi:hypothetical protein
MNCQENRQYKKKVINHFRANFFLFCRIIYYLADCLRVQLKGEQKGSKQVFVELPGLGDTIRMTEHSTLLVPFPLARSQERPIIFDLVGQYPLIRSFLCSVSYIRITENIEAIVHTYGVKYGLVVEYDLSGNILRSWHDPSGQTIKTVTNALLHNNKLYLASLFENFIAVVDY